jgi:hypothetical protein
MTAVKVPPEMIGIATNGETVVMGAPEMIEIGKTVIMIMMVVITMIMTTTLIIKMRPATVVGH